MFDVVVTCADGTAVSTRCPAQPNLRLITSTGYVPSKTTTLGQRKLQILVARNVLFTLLATVCAYSDLNFDTAVAVNGNVGSEGNVVLQPGPPPAMVKPGGGQPGNVYAVGTVQCMAGCSTQVSGAVYPNQPAGTVCPDKAKVVSSYTCTPGSANWAGGNLTINNGNASWNNITLNQGNTLTFDTTGLIDPLVVQVNSINANDNTTVVIKGGGSVTLIVKGTMTFGQLSNFGQDFATGSPVSPGSMVVKSCSTASGGGLEAVQFLQGGPVSGVFIAPNGLVHLVQRQAQGAILARSVQFDQGAGASFTFDITAQNAGFGPGYTTLRSWQDVP